MNIWKVSQKTLDEHKDEKKKISKEIKFSFDDKREKTHWNGKQKN